MLNARLLYAWFIFKFLEEAGGSGCLEHRRMHLSSTSQARKLPTLSDFQPSTLGAGFSQLGFLHASQSTRLEAICASFSQIQATSISKFKARKTFWKGNVLGFFHLLGKAFISGFVEVTSCSHSADLGILSHCQ